MNKKICYIQKNFQLKPSDFEIYSCDTSLACGKSIVAGDLEWVLRSIASLVLQITSYVYLTSENETVGTPEKEIHNI